MDAKTAAADGAADRTRHIADPDRVVSRSDLAVSAPTVPAIMFWPAPDGEFHAPVARLPRSVTACAHETELIVRRRFPGIAPAASRARGRRNVGAGLRRVVVANRRRGANRLLHIVLGHCRPLGGSKMPRVMRPCRPLRSRRGRPVPKRKKKRKTTKKNRVIVHPRAAIELKLLPVAVDASYSTTLVMMSGSRSPGRSAPHRRSRSWSCSRLRWTWSETRSSSIYTPGARYSADSSFRR